MSAPKPVTPSTRARKALAEFHEEGQAKSRHDLRMLVELWPILRPYQVWLWITLVTVTVSALLALVRPLIMLHTIDSGVKSHDTRVMMWGGAAFAAVAILEQLVQFAQIYAVQILGARSMADLRRKAFQHLCGLRLGFFDRQPVGRLVTRVTNDVDAIQELFASGALSAVGDLIRLVGIVILMVSLDPKLALIAFAAVPPIALLVGVVRRGARDSFREIRGKTARMNANMNEQVNGMAVIQAYGRQDAMAGEFDEINMAYRDANMRSVKFDSVQDAAIDAVSSISLASIIVALGYHPVSFGVVVAFSAYLRQFFEPISQLAARYTLLQSALAGLERVTGLFDYDEPDAPLKAPGSPGSNELAVELDHVTFGYKKDIDVLHEVSLSAKPGEKIALVGPTGSGKSTITALLLRLYDAQSGAVRVNGQDVTTVPREQLRRTFGVVPQDMFLFSGSVAENVATGEVPDPARVREALSQVGALELVERRQGGIDARVAPLGSNFSAGERQLLAFARAIYRDASILILDEATASVDSDTESRIQQALEKLLSNRTAIIVAHRLSTIRAADRIVVLQKGRVVERGTHDELLAQGGLYAALYELQFSRAAAE